MDWNRANRIYRQIMGAEFEDPHGLRKDLIQRAVRYARIRTDWGLLARKGRDGIGAERRTAHDAFIDACNILSRQMEAQGLDISWRADLGNTRLEIGDFACYVHCIQSIRTR